MTTDFRALCIELTDCLEKADWPLRHRYVFRQWIDIARAALADEPAVPEGREPASVTGQPSDEEIMGLMPQQMHEDLAYAARAMANEAGTDNRKAKGFMRIALNRHAVDLALAVLARWGNPAPQPHADGKAADRLDRYDQALSAVMPSDFKDWWQNSKDEWPDVAAGVIESLRKREELAWEQAERLSSSQPVPVSVSERLPGPGDCLDEGWAWFFSPRIGWRQAVLSVSAAYTHWLPAHALPLPEVK